MTIENPVADNLRLYQTGRYAEARPLRCLNIKENTTPVNQQFPGDGYQYELAATITATVRAVEEVDRNVAGSVISDMARRQILESIFGPFATALIDVQYRVSVGEYDEAQRIIGDVIRSMRGGA